jgi:subtilase family serine protease
VDGDCQIAEADETNNAASTSFGVGPDLWIEDFGAVVNGSSVTYTALVCSGSLATDPPLLKFWLNLAAAPDCTTPTPIYQTMLASLASANTCQMVSGTVPSMASGTYTSWLLVDGGCVADEMDESNNTRSVAVTVSP